MFDFKDVARRFLGFPRGIGIGVDCEEPPLRDDAWNTCRRNEELHFADVKGIRIFLCIDNVTNSHGLNFGVRVRRLA